MEWIPKHKQRPCGGILQRGPRIGQQCGNPAGIDGLCHSCRRRVTFARTNPRLLMRLADGTLVSKKKPIATLKEGFIVRMREDAKRLKMGKKPLTECAASGKKETKGAEKKEKVSDSLDFNALHNIWTIEVVSTIIKKMETLQKSQERLEENQRNLIQLFKGMKSQPETERSSSSVTSKSDS